MTRRKPNIIDQLRQAILESEESQLDIHEATGIDQGNLSKFLRKQRSISLETAADLCEHLGLELARPK